MRHGPETLQVRLFATDRLEISAGRLLRQVVPFAAVFLFQSVALPHGVLDDVLGNRALLDTGVLGTASS